MFSNAFIPLVSFSAFSAVTPLANLSIPFICTCAFVNAYILKNDLSLTSSTLHFITSANCSRSSKKFTPLSRPPSLPSVPRLCRKNRYRLGSLKVLRLLTVFLRGYILALCASLFVQYFVCQSTKNAACCNIFPRTP